ncbi:glycoside hydrolase family 3 N-terminal domain-containing protein [uncultured Roseivirga sp.]|uniref:glycoside hydrolase family 3 N-terminal domain-containing protein n=1 Tax=uncultured Roseivirga sp. TaxID=543088 RepID=UPI0030D9BFAC|tara:strand:- start:188811 stop:191738 length:2928 start_codon:yes stop_codon:yes gene_type:complete
MLNKVAFSILISFLFSTSLFGQKIYSKIDTVSQKAWADSVFKSMTPEERLGQLFMVAAYSNRDEAHYAEIDSLISKYNIGGLIFFQGGAGRQAHLTNRYQAKAKVPLAVAMDAEWGIGMRLDSIMDFPKQMTLGAIQDNRLIYEMGKEVANQFKQLNMHINFAPVVDVNVNPKNPVIGYRSFGENKFNVAEKGVAYMKGMQDFGIMANAKHFPGHGDTDVDSHADLPVINHSKERMNDIELYPFKALMKDSLMSVMVAHLQIPAYDSREKTPTTLSQKVVTDLLKKELGFDGLAFTDAMNMQGVAKYYEPGEADVRALMAGNDIILYPVDVAKGIDQVKKAIKKGDLTQTSLDYRVRRILEAKYWLGLSKYEPISTDNLTERINTSYAEMLNRILYQKAMTVVDNTDELVPIIRLDSTKFASLNFGTSDNKEFENTLSKYAKFDHFRAGTTYQSLLDSLASYNTVVVGYGGITNSTKDQHGVKSEEVQFIRDLQTKTNVIVVAFGNAYGLQFFDGVKNIICTYEDNEITRNIAPQIIFGALRAEGKLPVTTGSFKSGTGIKTMTASRLGFGLPEEVGMDSETLKGIDIFMKKAIDGKATPGGQVMVARKGKVIFSKNYGYQTYDSLIAVNDETMYDLASITKVMASVQVLMYLNENGLIDMNKTLGDYLPEVKGTNKEDLVIRDVLLHQAGLQPFIPFWKRTVENGVLNEAYYSETPGPSYNSTIADHVYGSPALADSVWKWVIDADLRKMPKGEKKYDYLYSDMGYYFFYKLAENILDKPFDVFLSDKLYAPLGLQTMGYLPTENGFLAEIAPTEDDNLFRKTLLRGTVHDQGAAMFGGVAGHAGLFSNALDLAVLMQMHLQLGQYGNQKYYELNTIPAFTSQQTEDNRRGMGWDKPIVGKDEGPTSRYASASTFGHSGFTGTAVWADPEQELIYVFLANRVYPNAENAKLIQWNIRTKIQDLIYESIWNFNKD